MTDASAPTPFMTRLGWRLEALGWDAYEAWYRAKGIDKASDAAGAMLRRIGPMTPTHNIARINMQRCFPEAEPVEIERLLGQSWEGFGRLIGEMPNMGAFADDGFFNERVEFVGRERLEAARDAGTPVVILGMHYSNWELCGTALMKSGLNCHITYRAANNPHIDARILEARARYDIKLMTAKGGDGAKSLMAALKAGESVALMNDQKMNDGIEVPFFGYGAMTAPGPTRLAMRHNAPLMMITVQRLGGVRFRVTVHEPIEISTNPDKKQAVFETVTRINQLAEKVIRQAPEQWFWVHRRWAKSVYKTG
ncbi:lysophospholipid acyltransferase family protein [Maricaulis sp.]|uniref:lysophospholipid acyltransferase family protein n=1 Tax=Maricaulis sp. TaxID=1486257 RepID=UPI00260D0F0F|nr:lysophospholipid acyltransferase family protein [Maricaulis sp.]